MQWQGEGQLCNPELQEQKLGQPLAQLSLLCLVTPFALFHFCIHNLSDKKRRPTRDKAEPLRKFLTLSRMPSQYLNFCTIPHAVSQPTIHNLCAPEQVTGPVRETPIIEAPTWRGWCEESEWHQVDKAATYPHLTESTSGRILVFYLYECIHIFLYIIHITLTMLEREEKATTLGQNTTVLSKVGYLPIPLPS